MTLKSGTTFTAARTVVVGAGFAGSSLIRALPQHLRDPGQTLLIDRRETQDFIPLAHEVAAGRLHPDSARLPISQLCAGRCGFLKTEVTGLSLRDKTLQTDAGEVSYEHLVLATGSSAARPPKPLSEHFHVFWSVEDALSVREDLARAWDRATGPAGGPSGGPVGGDEPLTIAIAGGGTTGVELAAELASLLRTLTRRASLARRPRLKPRVILLEASDGLMGWLGDHFHDAALGALEDLGVEVRLARRVEDASEGGVKAGGEWIPAAVRVWTAGLAVGGLAAMLPAGRDHSGRVRVGEHLTLEGYPEVYVAGDASLYMDSRLGPLPTTASVAVQQGPYIARDLGRRTRDAGDRRGSRGEVRRPAFEYFDRGYVVSLGPRDAVGEALGARLRGPAAHALYRSILLYYLKSSGGRASALSDWATEGLGRLGFP